MLLCDEDGCGAVQHAACSMQSDSRARHWRCDDCWLMAGERPAEGLRGVGTSSDRRGCHQAVKAAAKRKRTSTASRLGWVTGAKVLDACWVEHMSLRPCSMDMCSVAGRATLDFETTVAENYNCFWEHLTTRRVDLRHRKRIRRILGVMMYLIRRSI